MIGQAAGCVPLLGEVNLAPWSGGLQLYLAVGWDGRLCSIVGQGHWTSWSEGSHRLCSVIGWHHWLGYLTGQDCRLYSAIR